MLSRMVFIGLFALAACGQQPGDAQETEDHLRERYILAILPEGGLDAEGTQEELSDSDLLMETIERLLQKPEASRRRSVVKFDPDCFTGATIELTKQEQDSSIEKLATSESSRIVLSKVKYSTSTLSQTTDTIGLPSDRSSCPSGEGTVIAVLDSGIKRDHEFLSDSDGKSRVVGGACYSNPDQKNAKNGYVSTCTNKGNPGDPCSGRRCEHGTQVAGIAAGSKPGKSHSSGIAPKAKLYSIQLWQHNGTSELVGDDDLLHALCRVKRERKGGLNIVSANLSLGRDLFKPGCISENPNYHVAPNKLRVFEYVVDQLEQLNVAVVVAAGNGTSGELVSFPACMSSVVAVGATDDNDEPYTATNLARNTDFVAPGVNVTSSTICKNNVLKDCYAISDGTSLSAPQVAAAIALISNENPTWDVHKILDKLHWEAEHVGFTHVGVRHSNLHRLNLTGICKQEVQDD